MEGLLPAVKQQKLDEHLKSCSKCAQMYSQMEVIYGSIQNEVDNFTVSPNFSQQVMSKIERMEGHKELPKTVKLRPSTAISIAAAGIALGITIGTLMDSLADYQGLNSEIAQEQMAEEYFPTDLFSPYDELDNN